MTKTEREDKIKIILGKFINDPKYYIICAIEDINKLFEPVTYIPFTTSDFNEFMYKRICMKKDKEHNIWIIEGASDEKGVLVSIVQNTQSKTVDLTTWRSFTELLNYWQFEDGTPFGKQAK